MSCPGSDKGSVCSGFEEDLFSRQGRWYSEFWLDKKMDVPIPGEVALWKRRFGSHLYPATMFACFGNICFIPPCKPRYHAVLKVPWVT